MIVRALPAAALLAACFGPTYPEGLPCSDLQNCPPGQFCDLDALRCVKMELPGEVARPVLAVGPRHPTGWIDRDGLPLRLELVAADDPDVTFECRTGPSSMVAELDFAPCDGAAGDQPIHEPAPVPGLEEGSYETQVRALGDGEVSGLLVVPFYVHHSLDGVETCPALPDDEVFAAARGALETTGEFADDTALDNPFITIPFEDIIVTHAQADGSMGKWTFDMEDVRLELASLRRRFALDEARDLLLVQRQYESRRAREVTGEHVCKNGFRFGGRLVAPDGHRPIDCENLVLNRRGQGVCVVTSADGAKLGPATDLGYAKLAQRGALSPKGKEECAGCPWHLLIPE